MQKTAYELRIRAWSSDVCSSDLDADFGTRLLELQRFRARSGNARQHDRLAKQLLALRAIDAHDAGASLKEVAAILLPSEEWPGDGEHRKSFVRRLIVKGRHFVRAGPACILRPKRITLCYQRVLPHRRNLRGGYRVPRSLTGRA